jgi:hypothetical protein
MRFCVSQPIFVLIIAPLNCDNSKAGLHSSINWIEKCKIKYIDCALVAHHISISLTLLYAKYGRLRAYLCGKLAASSLFIA